MCYQLYIDDERTPSTNGPFSIVWVIVRNSNEAISYIIEHGFPVYVSFDNDLGEDSLEGHQIARWMVEYSIDHLIEFPANFGINVHSANPIAKENIESHFNSYNKIKHLYFKI